LDVYSVCVDVYVKFVSASTPFTYA
jgi:hypothetical protein